MTRMLRLYDLKELAGKTGCIKLAWTLQDNWSLLITTSDGRTWAGHASELEQLCLHCLNALNPKWSS